MTPKMTRLVLYTKHLDAMIDFYETHFAYEACRDEADRIVELRPAKGGMRLLLHPAAKSQKMGQALVKLVFDVEDVAEFSAEAQKNGLTFGKEHQADGYSFANAKDPSGNSIQISSRAFRH